MMDYNMIELENFLMEMQENSEVLFLETAEERSEILQIAKAKGIVLEDSVDLAIFKASYCWADKANNNKEILPSVEILRKLPTLIAKPVNIDHVRRYVCGAVIEFRYIEKEKKVIIWGTFYKKIFNTEWAKVQEMFKKKTLKVSYEVWHNKKDVKNLANGNYIIEKFQFAGCAILLNLDGNTIAASPDALVLEVAKQHYDTLLMSDLAVASLNTSFLKDNTLMCDKCKGEGGCNEVCKSMLFAQADQQLGATIVPPPIVPPTPEGPIKIICAHCGSNFESIFIQGSTSPIKCPNCLSIVDKAGKVLLPAQKIDFDFSCANCRGSNWLILKNATLEATLKCQSCAKEYDVKFKDQTPNELLKRLKFLRQGTVRCLACNMENPYAISSDMDKIEVKCAKCGLKTPLDIAHNTKREIESFAEAKHIPNKEELAMDPAVWKMDKASIQVLLKKAAEKIRKAKNDSKLAKASLVETLTKVDTLAIASLTQETQIVDLTKQLGEAKVLYFAQAKLVGDRRSELGDLAKDLTDDQLIDEAQYQLAIAKKVVLKTASTHVGDKPSADDEHYKKVRKEVDDKMVARLHWSKK